jgi:hypothetical protein
VRIAPPVMLPPGRARLAISPVPTGSIAVGMTIGIVVAAFLAARAAGGRVRYNQVNLEANHLRRKLLKLSALPSAYRRSTMMFCPSAYPSSRRALKQYIIIWVACMCDEGDPPHLACVLRARRKRPCSRTAKRGYQFPPSDVDWHVPLSVRGLPGEKNTTPRASGS